MSLSESERIPITMAASDDTSDPLHSRYPSPRWWRVVRWVLRRPVIFLLAYPAYATQNIAGLLIQGKPVTVQDLEQALLLDRALDFYHHPSLAVVPALAAVVVLLVLSWWAHDDWQREQKALQRREVGGIVDRRLEVLGEHGGTAAPQGPPVDLALLPLPVHLVGREAELAWVTNRLRQRGSSAVTALVGLGGIGKSGLAATAIHQVHDEGRFKDGIVVVNCNGKGKADAAVVLRDVLNRLDPRGRIVKSATTEDDLIRASRELIAGKEVLVVLDNVEPELPIERVTRPLLAADAILLLTARQTLPADAVPANGTLRLDLLPPDDALQVFTEAYGKGGMTELTPEEQAAARRIVERLDRHTLAVRLAGAHAAAITADLGRLARKLEDDPFIIPRDEEERAVELMIRQSTDRLPKPAKQLFVALAAFATPEFSRNAAEALVTELKRVDLGLGQADPGSTVDLLVKRALVDASIDRDMPAQTDRERLRMHLLVRVLARQWFDRWPVSARRRAQRAVASYYAAYSNQRIEPRWLARDQLNINGALEWAHKSGEQHLVERLCLGLADFWLRRGLIAEALGSLPWGIKAAQWLARKAGQRDRLQHRLNAATLSHFYGEALLRTGRLDEATEIFQRNRRTFEELGDRRWLGKTLNALGVIARERGQLDSAESYYQEAGNIHNAAEDREGEAEALMGLGQVAAIRGQSEQAEGHLKVAIDIYRKLDDPEDEGAALGDLGHIARELGRLADAEHSFQEALNIARAVQNRREEAALLLALGQTAEIRGYLDPAEENVKEALAIHREIRERQGEGVDLSALGTIAKARGQFDEAEAYVKQALAIHKEVSARREQGTDLRLLGQIAQARGRLDEAERYLQQAVQISREVDYRRGQGIALTSLGEVVLALGRPDEAEANLRKSLSILREVSDRIGYAAAALALGALLVSVRNQREEGCPLIHEAVTIRHEIGLPHEQKARDIAHQLGCDA